MKTPPSRLRRATQWCGRSLLLGFLLLAYGLVHLNQIGMPGFVKNPLLAELKQRGLALDFERLRLRLTRGIVAENVRIARESKDAKDLEGRFTADELQVRLNYAALLRGRVEVAALRLRDGQIGIPLAVTNEPPFQFQIAHVNASLRFVGTNLWMLDSLEGSTHGAHFDIAGLLTNAASLKRPSVTPPKPSDSDGWKLALSRWARRFDSMQFTNAPRLKLQFHADAAVPSASVANIQFSAQGADTEYGRLANLQLTADVQRPPDAPADASLSTQDELRLNLHVSASRTASQWGDAMELALDAQVDQPLTNQPPRRVDWSLLVAMVHTPWADASKIRVQGTSKRLDSDPAFRPPIAEGSPLYQTEWNLDVDSLNTTNAKVRGATMVGQATHSFNHWSRAAVSILMDHPETDWGSGDRIGLDLEASPNVGVLDKPELGFWGPLQRIKLQANLQASNVISPKIRVDSLKLNARWAAPQLELVSLETALYGGQGRVSGTLDIESREARLTIEEAVDLRKLAPLLTPVANRWLAQYDWGGATPSAVASLAVKLPGWTNHQPNWRVDVLPTLTLDGRFKADAVRFRDISAGDAEGKFTLTNASWFIPRVTLRRPEGLVQFVYRGDMLTQNYHFTLRSTIDPTIARPLLGGEKEQRAFDHFSLSTPPRIEGDIWGRWMEPERTGFRVQVTATNATVRGEPCDFADGWVSYTNQVLTFSNVTLHQGTGRASIPGAAYDVPKFLLSFTNAHSTLAPGSVTRVIGPKTAALIAPYHFVQPPHAIVNGVIGTRDEEDTRVEFDIDGSEFHWMRLRADQAKARLRWIGKTLTISNMVASCYGGNLLGDLNFWFTEPDNSDFNFGLAFTNVDLRRLMADVSDRTNRLEGQLSGVLNLDRAKSRDTNSWFGHGRLVLREGFLWDTPVFGIFSPIFEGLSPGMGQARFSSGNAHFVVTNSVGRTENLEVRSPAFRLKYSGTVDLQARLDARMEAELLKDLPVLGPVLSAAFTPFTKLFEYRVQGTLTNPIVEPLYIPKLLLVPLHPLKTLRDLFVPTDKKLPEPSPVLPVPNPPK